MSGNWTADQRNRVLEFLKGLTEDLPVARLDDHWFAQQRSQADDPGGDLDMSFVANMAIDAARLRLELDYDAGQLPAAKPEKTVALWYVRHYGTEYELFGSEQEAAEYGIFLADEDDSPRVLGVQFADGRTIERDAWPEWQAAGERERARRAKNRAEYEARGPELSVLDPFGGTEPIDIELSEPSWLGKQP